MATAQSAHAQLSSSWTWSPADPSTDDPYFKEFAAQGQNLFQAAGDSKKWTTSGTASETYPADDAYVTTVGGTDLQTAAAGGAWASETAWTDSGGGISPHKIAIPSWQTAAAAGCASCSQTYRNGPDAAANANFTSLRLRGSNNMHGELIRRDQLCRSDVGAAIWRWPISNPSPMGIKRWASSTRPYTRSELVRATLPTSMTLRAGAPATRPRLATISSPVGVVPTEADC